MIERWKSVALSELATLHSGGTPNKERSSFWGGPIPWVTVKDMKAMRLNGVGESLTEEGANTVRVVPAGAVLVLVRGMGLFKDLPVVLCDRPVTFNQDIKALVAKEGVDSEYLAFALIARKSDILRHVDSAGHGTGRLDTDLLKSTPLPLPPLPEQRKIAEILRTWDVAIEKLEALRAAKLRRHRALTHSLVFGTRQLDRFRTTDEVAAHRWFTLPATWGIKPIGKLAHEISERNGDREQHEVLSCSKYDGFVRSLEYFKKQVFSADLSGYKKIWRGDFGFPSNHVEEGSIGLQNLTDVGVVSPIYTVFRFAPEKVDADYAFAVLKTGLYRHIFEVSTSASVDRRGSLRWSEFSKLPFPVPSLAEQKAIAEVLRTAKVGLTVVIMDDNKSEMPKLSDGLYQGDAWFDGLYQTQGKKRGKTVWLERSKKDRFDHIINTAFAIKSDHSSMVQVADAISYVYRRHLELQAVAEAWAGEKDYYAELVAVLEPARETLGHCPDAPSVKFYKAAKHAEWNP
ncbi:restriction endonuclease subunit S [Nitrobacter sp. TKz-YC01]